MSKAKEECAYRKGWNEGFDAGLRSVEFQGARPVSIVYEYIGATGDKKRPVCSQCHHIIWDWWCEKPRYCAFCGGRIVY